MRYHINIGNVDEKVNVKSPVHWAIEFESEAGDESNAEIKRVIGVVKELANALNALELSAEAE